MATLLTQPDIPTGLTHTQVAGVSLLSNVLVVLLRTLIAKGIINEEFTDGIGEGDDIDWDLDHLIYVIEQLGGSYGQPNFDHVEDA